MQQLARPPSHRAMVSSARSSEKMPLQKDSIRVPSTVYAQTHVRTRFARAKSSANLHTSIVFHDLLGSCDLRHSAAWYFTYGRRPIKDRAKERRPSATMLRNVANMRRSRVSRVSTT